MAAEIYQSDLPETIGIPALRRVRRFADHQHSSDSQHGCRAFCNHRRGSERSTDHGIEPPPKRRIVSQIFRSATTNFGGDTELNDRFGEKGAPLHTPVKQGQPGVREVECQHQPRNASTRSKIQDPPCGRTHETCKSMGMFHVEHHIPRSKESLPPALLEHLEQRKWRITHPYIMAGPGRDDGHPHLGVTVVGNEENSD